MDRERRGDLMLLLRADDGKLELVLEFGSADVKLPP